MTSLAPTALGMRATNGQLFCLEPEDRFHHAYTVGRTGMGKSTLLRNVILQDIAAGDGVCLIDPHGDLAEEVLDHIPDGRLGDVVYFNPADQRHPAGLNLLSCPSAAEGHLVVSGVVSAFKHLWRDSWGPRLEYVLSNALATAVDHGNFTLLGVYRLLSDAAFRDRIIRRVHDPVLRAFWEDEFAGYSERFRAEVLAPVQNKLGRLMTAPLLRNILGQVRSTFDVDEVINSRKILIVNLSTGQLGQDKADLLGSLLISQLYLAATRARLPESKRPDFHLVIDEFQNFGTDAFASILSEARKYRLSLFLGHQFMGQIPKQLRQAVFGNVGTIVAFGVGAEDAAALEPELPIPARNLVDSSKHEVWVRLLRAGESLQPFKGTTLPPLGSRQASRKTLIHQSRRQHARTKKSVEHTINRWLQAG